MKNNAKQNKTKKHKIRFSKSVSLLNRLNQRAINAMKLHIPALIHHNPPNDKNNKHALLLQHKDMIATTTKTKTTTATMLCSTNVINLDENDELMFQTPNSSVREDYVVEDFRTPLNEMPSPPPLSANSMYNMNMNMKYLNTPSPTYRSVNSNSRSCSRDSDLSEGDIERDSESETADDSGLDENFHTPRVAKIKSMENLSILEMEFHKASQELDRNSPRRLKWLAERERMQMPKMKSLNNLCFDDYSEEQMRAEFQIIREQNLEEKLRFQLQQRKNSTSSSNSGKLYMKNTKVGNAKFIGNDESTAPLAMNNNTTSLMHYPIQKMRSMGTIPDVVTERIEPDPFLTPTSARKPQFPQLVTQSAEKATAANLNSYAAHRLLNYDCVDGSGGGGGGSNGIGQINHHSYNSLNELYSQDRLGKLNLANDVSFMSRTPFERAYRRSLMKSSTPLRQSWGLIQQQFSSSNEENTITATPTYARPHSNNAAYDMIMRFVALIFFFFL